MEKRSLYVDMRDDDENDTMDNWDDGKLREVVDKKHSLEKRMPTTDIVSSDFIAWPAENCIQTNRFVLTDLQVLLGCGGKIEIRLVLGMSKW